MKCHNWLYLFFYTPGVALGILWLHHIVEMFMLHGHDGERNYATHPWYIFAASMSVVLFVFHMYVFIAVFLRKWDLSWCRYAGKHPERTELFMLMVDISWSVLWLLQIVVQLMLTRRHRLYRVRTVLLMLGLYIFQLLVAIPLMVFIFRRWKEVRRNRAINSDSTGKVTHVASRRVRALVRG